MTTFLVFVQSVDSGSRRSRTVLFCRMVKSSGTSLSLGILMIRKLINWHFFSSLQSSCVFSSREVLWKHSKDSKSLVLSFYHHLDADWILDCFSCKQIWKMKVALHIHFFCLGDSVGGDFDFT